MPFLFFLVYFLNDFFPGLTPSREGSVILPTVDTFGVCLIRAFPENVAFLCAFTAYLLLIGA